LSGPVTGRATGRPILARVVLALAIAGCGTEVMVATEGSETRADGEPSSSDDPTDRAWQLHSFPAGAGEVAAGAEATLEFDGEAMAGGTGGCNRWAGGYELGDGKLSFGLIRTTMMACPDEPRSRQEQVFLEALRNVAGYELADGRLRLLDAGGEWLMTLAPRPDLTLAGTLWEAVSVNDGRQAVVSIDEAGQPTAHFGDGTVAGSGGCNSYTASVSLGDGTIEIGPAAATRKMCPQPGVMEQETRFFAALETAVTYSIDRDRLELRTATGALAVEFRAAIVQE
jgi:heat shock protein HslJ